MKKSKILVPAIALLALGVAGSTVGTVAWFTAGTVTPTAGTIQSASIASKTDTLDIGSFVVNVTAVHESQESVSLTNASGDTFLWDGTSNIKAPAQAVKASTVTVDMSVVYTGSLDDAGAIKNLWLTSLAAHPVTLRVEDISATDTLPDGKTRVVTGGGLKFSASNESAAIGATPAANLTGVSVALSDVTFGTVSGSGDAKTSTASKNAAGTFYVAIAGVDNVYQYGTDYYCMKVSPVI